MSDSRINGHVNGMFKGVWEGYIRVPGTNAVDEGAAVEVELLIACIAPAGFLSLLYCLFLVKFIDATSKHANIQLLETLK